MLLLSQFLYMNIIVVYNANGVVKTNRAPEAVRDKWSDINKIRNRSLLCFTTPFSKAFPFEGQVASCKISF